MGMLAVFVIVFREVLEIALTLVLVLVGTRSVPQRARWIWLGLLLGVSGSVVVAALTDTISNALEGMGQELFQGTILSISAILVIYTVVWMKRHAGAVVESVQTTSAAVRDGVKPLLALSSVIAITVLRDGAEVVLLSQGLIASGLTVMAFALGAGAAVFVGSFLGLGIYYGILRLRMQTVFSVLSASLVLIGAGMAAQAAGFFSAAGYLPEIRSRLWDTSWLISDQSLLGQFLHVFVGYVARPSAMQVMWYGITVLASILLIYLSARRSPSDRVSTSAA